MIDIRIEKVKIRKNSKQVDVDGLEFSYRIDNRNQWNCISLTNEDALKFTDELSTFLGMKLINEK